MYDYRKMTPAQRHEAVEYRRLRMRPWHSPPHWEFEGLLQFMISSACYEHRHIIGTTPKRMTECERGILDLCERFATNTYAWCVLPNHYHVLMQTDRLKEFRIELGKFHGRTSFRWNGEDNSRGRHVWHNWPWSSAKDFIKRVGRDTATRIWHQNPVLDYGKTWDVDEKPD